MGDHIFKAFVAWMIFVGVLSAAGTAAVITACYYVGKHFSIW